MVVMVGVRRTSHPCGCPPTGAMTYTSVVSSDSCRKREEILSSILSVFSTQMAISMLMMMWNRPQSGLKHSKTKSRSFALFPFIWMPQSTGKYFHPSGLGLDIIYLKSFTRDGSFGLVLV